MNILVLGATGMAGHIITLYLMEQGHAVTAYSRTPFPYGKHVTGDITDASVLRSVLFSGGYDAIVNCIGILNDACDREPSRAVYVNSYLPRLMVNLLKDSPAKLIHLSTDCVFSGRAAPYRETSFRDGETLYDRTKALGEPEPDDGKSLTFRNSIIGPDLKRDGIGLFNWFMRQTGRVNGYTGAIWNGVTTLTLAKAVERAVTVEPLTGIYHLVPERNISKYDLLLLMNKQFKGNTVEVLPCDTVRVDKTLINSRTDFAFPVPGYEEMLMELKEWVQAHHSLYPHYSVGTD